MSNSAETDRQINDKVVAHPASEAQMTLGLPSNTEDPAETLNLFVDGVWAAVHKALGDKSISLVSKIDRDANLSNALQQAVNKISTNIAILKDKELRDQTARELVRETVDLVALLDGSDRDPMIVRSASLLSAADIVLAGLAGADHVHRRIADRTAEGFNAQNSESLFVRQAQLFFAIRKATEAVISAKA